MARTTKTTGTKDTSTSKAPVAPLAVAAAPEEKLAMNLAASVSADAAKAIASQVELADSNQPVKKMELVDRVVESTGLKRKDVKPVVEAMLAELGKVIDEGKVLQMPELGKLMIHKRKDVPNGEVVMLKLRRKTAVQPLAKDGEDS